MFAGTGDERELFIYLSGNQTARLPGHKSYQDREDAPGEKHGIIITRIEN